MPDMKGIGLRDDSRQRVDRAARFERATGHDGSVHGAEKPTGGKPVAETEPSQGTGRTMG